MAAVHFTTMQYLGNRTKPFGHRERYGLMAIPILAALLLSSLNDLQFFFVFLYALVSAVNKGR